MYRKIKLRKLGERGLLSVCFWFSSLILGIALVQFINILSDAFHHGATSHAQTLQLIVLSLKLRCGAVGSLSTPF